MALGVAGVQVGCWTDIDHDTGVTVVLPPPGTLGGVAVRGGAPGTRETDALRPYGSGVECHAIALCGNSVYGLAAADGVVRWCEKNGRGLEYPAARIPIVGAAVVFDVREAGVPRVDAEAGWAACEAASEDDPPIGAVGVGRGCTVGKAAGREFAVKGGQGWAVMSDGGVTVGAVMAVNALGNVLAEDGSVLAGDTAPPDAPRHPTHELPRDDIWGDGEGANTVIGCVVTDARLTKTEACRAADLAHSGIARAVSPAHTSFDGDTIFALCTQQVEVHVDLVAELGAKAVATAIREAVRHV